jgi:hypothetical protein
VQEDLSNDHQLREHAAGWHAPKLDCWHLVNISTIAVIHDVYFQQAFLPGLMTSELLP